jgi:putative tricarboxylic transport membrane protein
MARAGRGGPALATAAIGSFVAGLIATLGLAFVAPWMVKFALSLGPADYFALMVLAFVTVSAAFGDSALRGLTALFLGLTLGLVGIDLQTGQARLTFGVPDLLDGIEVTTLAVALFAVGEALKVAAGPTVHEEIEPVKGSVWMTANDWARSWKAWLRGTAIGFPIGAMPAGGAEIGTFLSYSTEKALTRHPEEFGNGAIEGVAGPEAANNASAAGTLVPLLTLGLPTSATAAIMLAGFQQFGLQPGPLLFVNNAPLVWSLIASLLVANLMLIVLNLPLVGVWVRLLAIPRPWLYAGILVFATLGTIGANPSTFELGLLLAFGLLGYLLRRFHYPIAPVVVGLILGPLAEQQLRRALAISQGDPTILVSTPVALVLYAITAAALIVPLILRLRGKGDVLERLHSEED